MADRYYVGGTGNWSDYASHWSASSGGAPGASLPTASDNVYFDENSFTGASQRVTINTDSACLSMNWTGAANTPQLLMSGGNLSVYGSITFMQETDVILYISHYIDIKGTCNLTTNGTIIGCSIRLPDAASILNLQDDLTIRGSIKISAGVFNTNDKDISVRQLSAVDIYAKTLTFGSSTITCTWLWETFAYPNTITITDNTAKIIMTEASTFSGGNQPYGSVELQGTQTTITGWNTFGELILNPGILVVFESGTTQTVTTLSGEGTPTERISLASYDDGIPYTISITSGIVNKYYYSIKDCIATGGATFNALNALDMTGNAGWIFYDIEPEITYPSAETIIVNEDLTFTWDFAEVEGVQTHYDLDLSTNGIVWTPYAEKVESTDMECVITAGTLSSRIYYWRVRIWFLDGTYASEYSQSSFVAVINPETSEVDCDLMPMPTVTWTASEQQAFQLKVGTYDTGTIYSELGTYTVPYYFDDGAYGITVRTQNNLGIWSAWTALAYFEISNVPGGAITLTAEQFGNAINLIWTTAGTYSKYYIYRNDVPIADVTDTAYADNFAYGTATYKVRGIMDDGYYTMSDETEQELMLTADTVSEVDVIAWLPLAHSLGGPVSRSYSKSDEVSYLKFAGRSYPVSASSGFKNRRGSFTYAFKTRAEIETLVDLSGSTVIHKDTKGNRTIGVINDFTPVYKGKFYYSVSFNITQTDYNEAVTYD